MRNVSSSAGSIGYGEISWETGELAAPSKRQEYQSAIDKANTISIVKLFKMYGVHLDDSNRKTTCPFKSHKGGRESTASFYYYPSTNTYCCYGCRQGSSPVDFVMNMDRCTHLIAAHKILEHFSGEVEDGILITKSNFSETMSIMMEFSNAVRDFRMSYSDEESFSFIENICFLYDTINQKHNLNNDALQSTVSQLIEHIKKYKL